MKQNIIAAALLGLCLIVAAIIFSGRYYLVRVDAEKLARLDRWTGSVKIICLDEWDWSPTCLDAPSSNKAGVGETMNVEEIVADGPPKNSN